jgi:ATP-binding cassette subfamily B protein
MHLPVTAPTDNKASSQALTDASSHTISNSHLLRWMFAFLKPVKRHAVIAGLILAAACGLEILATRQTGEVLNHVKDVHQSAQAQALGFWRWIASTAGEPSILRGQVLVLILFVLGMLILRYLREVAAMKLSMQMVFYLREAIYDKLQHVGFRFHDAISSGQLINRALTDLQNVRGFLQTAVLTSLEIALIVGGYMILILTRNPLVALLSLVPLPFWVFYILKFGKKIQPVSKSVLEANDRNVSLITENIAGVHVVKAFATEQQEIDKYSENCQTYFGRIMRAVRLWANFTPVIRSIGMASHLSLFLLAGILMLKGQLQVGDFLILGSAMGAILGRLQQVSVINEQYQNAIVSARRLYEVLMAPPTVPERFDAIALPPGNGELVFEHVTFGYNPASPVLRDLTVTVPGGSVVALVGPTGAGKSTLVNLIARFYDPQQGRILIDGIDLRDLRLDSLRREVGFVFQETYLFSDTIEANIAYGRPKVRGGEVEAAARLAQAHEFIEKLPLQYQTMLGERGSSLSGGQRQRLAIARAILFDPRILVLDDATASVDPETEDLIRRGMGLVMLDRTTFVIAHRVSTLKRADLVLVIEHGQITQMGTHAELMRQPGHYRDIALAQLMRDMRPGEAESHMDRMKVGKHAAKPDVDPATSQPSHAPPQTVQHSV